MIATADVLARSDVLAPEAAPAELQTGFADQHDAAIELATFLG